MIPKKYIEQIKSIISNHLTNGKIFIYGSSVSENNFNDIDVGIMESSIDERTVYVIKNELEESNLPYKFDIINFDKVDNKFKNKVLKDKIIWLT